jgi:hypothetical protein
MENKNGGLGKPEFGTWDWFFRVCLSQLVILTIQLFKLTHHFFSGIITW